MTGLRFESFQGRGWLHANGAAARLFAALALLAGAARGGTVTTLDWSGNGVTIGGSGTWNLTGYNWTPDASNFEPWNNGTAQFFGASGTVTLGSAITAAGLNFASTGFTLTGGNTLTMSANGQITLDSGTSTNINTPVVANAGLLLQGNGTLNINGSLGGSLTLSGNGLSSLNNPVLNLVSDPTGGAALTINGASGSGTFGGTITGAGSLVQSGGTAVTLSGANTFTGSTTITGGSLVLGNALALQNSTVNINVDNGLNLNGLASATINGLTGTGALNLGATALTVGGSAATTYSGVLSGTTGGLTYAGTGTLALSGGGSTGSLAVSSGAVNVTGGTLALAGNGAAGVYATGGALTISGGATVTSAVFSNYADGTGAVVAVSGAGTTLNSGGEFFTDSGGTLAVSNGAAVNTSIYIFAGGLGSGTLNFSSGATVTDPAGIMGGFSGSTGTATVTGTGSLWANATLDLGGFAPDGVGGTGTVNINSGGSVTVSAATTLWTSASSLNINGGTLTTGSLQGTTGTINLTADPAGGSALTINGASGSTEFDGTITGAGSLVKSGGSSQILGAVNTFTGPTTINGGQLVLANGLALQNSLVNINVDNGLNLNGLASATINGLAGTGALKLGTTALTVAGTATTTYSGTLSGTAGSLIYAGTGALTLSGGGTIGSLYVNSGAVNLTGTLTASLIDINGGTLTTGQLVGTGTINLQANPVGGLALVLTGGAGPAEFDGTITGTGGISLTGGNQILTGANTYTGQTLVSGATLTQQGGSNNSQITVGNGAVFNAVSTTLSPLNGFGIIATQPGGLVQYDGATVNGGFLEGTGHSIIGEGATFTGTTITLGALVTQNAAATMNVVTLNGTIDNNATLTWSGGTIGSGGVVNVNSLVNATGLVTNGEINIFDGATLAGSGTDLVLGAGSRTYVGSLANPGGTLSETGGTIDLNGGLLVNNGTVDGTLDVNFGGLAEGAGTYGAVNVTNGGVFHPGNSPGTVTSSSADLGAGGGFDFDIDNATGTEGTDWSLWNITGDLDITAGMTPNSEFTIFLDSLTSGDAPGPLENFNPADSYSWTILDAANIAGFSANEFTLNTTGFDESLDGGTFSLVSNGQDLTLDFTPETTPATPEPGTWFLLGSGVLALGLVRRKRAGAGGV